MYPQSRARRELHFHSQRPSRLFALTERLVRDSERGDNMLLASVCAMCIPFSSQIEFCFVQLRECVGVLLRRRNYFYNVKLYLG